MSDITGRIYGTPTRKGRKTGNEGSAMQEVIAQQLLDPELVPEITLRKVTLALGTESREDSAALVRADIQAAKLAAKIIRTGPTTEQKIPEISSPRPAAPATAPKGSAKLKF